MSVKEKIEDIFILRNHQCKKEELQWRLDGRLEWVCEHGIEHTVFDFETDNKQSSFTHGCDGCCNKLVKFEIKFHIPKSLLKRNN